MNDESIEWISSSDLANYVVCPEAWRLKYVGAGQRRDSERTTKSRELRKDWVEKQELSGKLRSYAKITYVLLVILTIVVFCIENHRSEFISQISLRLKNAQDQKIEANTPRTSEGLRPDLATIPNEIVSLLLLLGLLIFMWDLFDRRSRGLQKDAGLKGGAETIAVKGSSQMPSKLFESRTLGLRSKPDAVLREGDMIIPADIYPLGNKVRDRHVIQLLAHLRLIEEDSGQRPEFGVLIMGREKRRVQVKNTPEKQRWLEGLIDEMRSIMNGVPAVPAPAVYKCRSCDVREVCDASLAKEPENVSSSKKEDDESEIV